jgi:hypothetical protein
MQTDGHDLPVIHSSVHFMQRMDKKDYLEMETLKFKLHLQLADFCLLQ